MRKVIWPGLMAGVVLLAVAVAPVAAAARTPVHMEVATEFDPAADPFVATGIAGCSSGTVADGSNTTSFLRYFGLYVGYKVFDCGGGSGFLVRLNAMFSYSGGSIGTWAIVDSWGAVAGLHGSGSLVGTSTGETSILDVYDGTVN